MKIERHKKTMVSIEKRGLVIRLLEHRDPRYGHVSLGIWKRDDGLWWVFKSGWREFPPPAKRLKDVARPAIALALMGELT